MMSCQFDSVDGEFTCIDKSREAAGGARGLQGDVLGGGRRGCSAARLVPKLAGKATPAAKMMRARLIVSVL